jgi:hypothetical protein
MNVTAYKIVAYSLHMPIGLYHKSACCEFGSCQQDLQLNEVM